MLVLPPFFLFSGSRIIDNHWLTDENLLFCPGADLPFWSVPLPSGADLPLLFSLTFFLERAVLPLLFGALILSIHQIVVPSPFPPHFAALSIQSNIDSTSVFIAPQSSQALLLSAVRPTADQSNRQTDLQPTDRPIEINLFHYHFRLISQH